MASPKILVADDEFYITRAISRLLTTAGFECIQAADGEEALQLIRSERPAVVFLDLDMPKMNGLDVLRCLRDDPQLRNTPVFILTATTLGLRLEGGRIDGAREVLLKPFDPKELVQRVHEALNESPPASGSEISDLQQPGR